jgi:hypothetical protein
MNDGVGLRKRKDGRDGRINRGKEVLAQARTLLLVPLIRGVNVGRSRWPKPC